MIAGVERTRAYRARQGERLLAQWLDDPATVDAVLAAIRSPELLVHQPLESAMRELRAFGRAWFGRGLRLPPSPDQLAHGLDALVVPGAGDSATRAMEGVPRRGNTYALWGAAVGAAMGAAERVGAWAADQLARLSGRRPARPSRRKGSPASPSQVTDSSAFSPHAPATPVRTPGGPPEERPPDRPRSLADLMPGIAEQFKDRTKR